MILDVILDKDSLTIDIGNPFQLDLDSVVEQIEEFSASRNITLSGVDLKGLIPRMIRGIAGCESGCPANAKGLVERGFKNFDIRYIEGGILSAQVTIRDEKTLALKIFPEF